MPRWKTPEQTRTNASRSRCAASMPAWTLNTKALNGVVERARLPPSAVGPGRRRRARGRAGRRAAGRRRSSAPPRRTAPAWSARRGTRPGRGRRRLRSSSSCSSTRRRPRRPLAAPCGLGGVEVLLRGDGGAAGGAGELDELAGRAGRARPRKSPATPTGQVSGVGREPDARRRSRPSAPARRGRAGPTC